MYKFICASCKKELNNVFESDKYIQPSGGVAFEGSATYGSGFDTAAETMIIVVCDECLKELLNTTNGVFTEKVVTPAVKKISPINSDDLTYI